MHADQLTISVRTVRSLISEQFPRWRGLRVSRVRSSGTVNGIFRIGPELAARFPLQQGDPDATRLALTAEVAAAAELASHTAFAVPEPVALGEPGHGYPMPWSVQTWVHGTDASVAEPADPVAFARDLAAFISDVRSMDTRGRVFSGHGRGGGLAAHDEWMAICFRESEGLLDVAAMRLLWTQMRELPRSGPDVMTHGDLIPANLLLADGRLVGVIDVGGLGPADPALDLICAWHLLDTGPRAQLRAALRCSDVEWARGRAWAFQQAMGLVWYYRRSNPTMSALGRRTLQRILSSAD